MDPGGIGATVVRRQARVDRYVQDGGAGWRRGGMDGRPSKEDASVLAVEMDRWKMVEAASESASDRYGIQSQTSGEKAYKPDILFLKTTSIGVLMTALMT
ncbi:U-box domain-containing protein 7 [Hordeum vulgare]|nr:U-box domain-containing protein 7 [Hordeum vulgare]